SGRTATRRAPPRGRPGRWCAPGRVLPPLPLQPDGDAHQEGRAGVQRQGPVGHVPPPFRSGTRAPRGPPTATSRTGGCTSGAAGAKPRRFKVEQGESRVPGNAPAGSLAALSLVLYPGQRPPTAEGASLFATRRVFLVPFPHFLSGRPPLRAANPRFS